MGADAGAQILIENRFHISQRVDHQIAADQTRLVGQTVGETVAGRVQQQARRPRAPRRQDDEIGGQFMIAAIGIHIAHPADPAVIAHQQLLHRTAGPQFHPLVQGMGPIGDVDAALGALGTAGVARPQIGAGGAAVVMAGVDGGVRRPPMPAQRVEPLGQLAPHRPQRDRRQQGLVLGIGRVAHQPRHPHHLFVLGEIGFQLVVSQRPVVPDAVQRPSAEIGRMEAGEMGGIQDGATAQAVEIGQGYGRVRIVDGIVTQGLTDIGIEAGVTLATQFPTDLGGGIMSRVGAFALFQTDDAKTGAAA